MDKGDSKNLVIDASIARSAGETEHHVSKCCREFLQATLKICHRIVMSKRISIEWKRHRSKFSSKWQSEMTARKKICEVEDEKICRKDIRDKIESLPDSKKRDAMNKDKHLIEASIATDLIVISKDDVARTYYKEIIDDVQKLSDIIWVNPVKQEENALDWLQKGAKPEKHRQLGNS